MSDGGGDTPGGVRRHATITVLDFLRPRIAPDAFDAVVFGLESVAADLGYGDVRPLPGSVAWIDRLRECGKRIGLIASNLHAARALDLAGIYERFDDIVQVRGGADTLRRALEDAGVSPGRAIGVSNTPEGIADGSAAGLAYMIGLARDKANAERMRQSGATAVVADLQELLALT